MVTVLAFYSGHHETILNGAWSDDGLNSRPKQ